jgi:hypothetical protein
LQEVIDLLTVDGNRPNIVSGDYEFEDAEELFKYLGEGGKHQIEISRSRPTIRFRSSGLSPASIVAYDSGDASVALFHRVVAAMKYCNRRAPFRFRSWSAGVTCGITAFGLVNAQSHSHSWLVAPYVFVGLVGAALTIWVFKAPLGKGTTFYGVNRGAQRTFWQRKGDDILVSILSGVFGAVLGVGGTLAAQWLSK